MWVNKLPLYLRFRIVTKELKITFGKYFKMAARSGYFWLLIIFWRSPCILFYCKEVVLKFVVIISMSLFVYLFKVQSIEQKNECAKDHFQVYQIILSCLKNVCLSMRPIMSHGLELRSFKGKTWDLYRVEEINVSLFSFRRYQIVRL